MSERATSLWLCFVLVASSRLFAGTIGNTSVTPTSTQTGVAQIVTITSVITDPSLIPASVNLQQLDSSGRVVAILGTLHDDGLNGDLVAGDGTYTLLTTIFQNNPMAVTLRVSAAFKGSLLRVYSAPLVVNVTGTATGVAITTPSEGAYTNISPIAVSGVAGDPRAAVLVNGIQAPLNGTTFNASVPLREGPNTITAVASNTNGTTSTGSVLVTLDTMPPHVSIYTPSNGYVTTDASATVTGMVNDIVVGTVNSGQATVKVNGIVATVSNRTFMASGIPLTLGSNTIQAIAIDQAGNSATTSVSVTRVALTQETLKVYSGDGQSAQIRTTLSQPLVAQLVNASGNPIANVPVIFQVTGQDGLLGTGRGVSDTSVNTNGQGLASIAFTVGSRIGAGNNLIQASTTGVATTAVFTESATAAPAGLIVVDSGNNQSGVIASQLPLPFIAIVTDTGNNRLPGVSVTFTAKSGGGNFNGSPTYTTVSDSDGRVEAFLTLGPNQGTTNNVVEANFTGNTGFPATFTATGLQPGPADFTQISGVVLDNSNIPIPGVTMRLFAVNQGNTGNVPQQVVNPVVTNAQGQFTITNAPVGVFKLMADGSTVQSPLYPTLEYDIITVTGQNNTVGMPIYLPRLIASNTVCVDANTGGTLTIPQAPGFSLTIAPGSATFPGGSKTGCVSVTPVNMDKVPMAPGFGQQPRFIVTIQPVGATFNPPAAMSIPNVDGLPPRAVTEMYSYDHDLASFVSIGTGTVSSDGSVISSDPGVGVLKAGWHCGGNPNTSGSAGTCPACQTCQGSGCMPDPSIAPTIQISLPDTLNIDTTPAMPTITATAQVVPSGAPVNWTAQITYTSAVGGCSGGPNFNSPQETGQGTSFAPDFQGIYGGVLTVTATTNCGKGASATATRTVGGTDPSATDIRATIGTVSSPFDPDDLKRIACQESGQHQFGSDNSPILGSNGDAGIMQICYHRTTADFWNWKTNIADGRSNLLGTLPSARGIPAQVRKQFPDAPDFTTSQLRLESIEMYNVGTSLATSYWQWDDAAQMWIATNTTYANSVVGKNPNCRQ